MYVTIYIMFREVFKRNLTCKKFAASSNEEFVCLDELFLPNNLLFGDIVLTYYRFIPIK